MLQLMTFTGYRLIHEFMFLVLVACTFPLQALATEINTVDSKYQLGRGLHLHDNKLILGGYTNLQFSKLDNEKSRIDLRSLSLIVNWQIYPRWQLFSELELVDALTITSDEITTDDAALDVERLYIEYAALPDLNLRFGKFLTPIGRWNQIHAAPLVWTVSRPLVSTLPFSRHTTGLSMNGYFESVAGGLDYIVYLDDSEALDPDGDESFFLGPDSPEDALIKSNAFNNAVGAFISYRHWHSNLELGLSLANFSMRDAEVRKNLIGFNFLWSKNRFELSSEAVYRYSSEENDKEWGGFLQAVLPVWRQLYAVARYEKFYIETIDASTRNTSIGLAYRPTPPIVYKLEYREGVDNIQFSADGLLASFAVLF